MAEAFGVFIAGLILIFALFLMVVGILIIGMVILAIIAAAVQFFIWAARKV